MLDEANNNASENSKLQQSFNRLQSSENFDEHLSANCVEFDDTASG